ncbi:hypothetical protein SAMN05443248_3019 [Bradyrhizobium erythrophlei]|uniref:Uncharacterized protein n=1 Tax=Bradyrhizobium erythrophlei TaxID=1437360 RepID=A0A1M5NJN0_9BRAD|nr:hypothetical protein SAMN05443248_3019 [Bradyrhizobium erythrophlei]
MHLTGAKEKRYFCPANPLKYNDFCPGKRGRNGPNGPNAPESALPGAG